MRCLSRQWSPPGQSRLQLLCFFFQAEDGIRYLYVTGVQTCALPISQRMAEGDELGGAFGCENASRTGDAEDVALGRVAAADDPQRRGRHLEDRPRHRFADGLTLVGDVHHARRARRRQVGEAAERAGARLGQAVTPERACRMTASIRSLAISFSFFSSLIRHCWSAESGAARLSASSSWSWAWCSLRRRRNSSFSAVNRSMRVSWSMRGLLGWRVRNSWVLPVSYSSRAPAVSSKRASGV